MDGGFDVIATCKVSGLRVARRTTPLHSPSMGILKVAMGDLDFLNRVKPAQKPECFHFEQNSPNKVKLVQKKFSFLENIQILVRNQNM